MLVLHLPLLLLLPHSAAGAGRGRHPLWAARLQAALARLSPAAGLAGKAPMIQFYVARYTFGLLQYECYTRAVYETEATAK